MGCARERLTFILICLNSEISDKRRNGEQKSSISLLPPKKSLTCSGASPQYVINVRCVVCFAEAPSSPWPSALVAGKPVGGLFDARELTSFRCASRRRAQRHYLFLGARDITRSISMDCKKAPSDVPVGANPGESASSRFIWFWLFSLHYAAFNGHH